MKGETRENGGPSRQSSAAGKTSDLCYQLQPAQPPLNAAYTHFVVSSWATNTMPASPQPPSLCERAEVSAEGRCSGREQAVFFFGGWGVNEAVINARSTQWPEREPVCSCPIRNGPAQPGPPGTSGAAGPDKVYLAKPRVSHTYSLTLQWRSLSRAVNRPPVFLVFSPLWNSTQGFHHITPGSSSGRLQHQGAQLESLGEETIVYYHPKNNRKPQLQTGDGNSFTSQIWLKHFDSHEVFFYMNPNSNITQKSCKHCFHLSRPDMQAHVTVVSKSGVLWLDRGVVRTCFTSNHREKQNSRSGQHT